MTMANSCGNQTGKQRSSSTCRCGHQDHGSPPSFGTAPKFMTVPMHPLFLFLSKVLQRGDANRPPSHLSSSNSPFGPLFHNSQLGELTINTEINYFNYSFFAFPGSLRHFCTLQLVGISETLPYAAERHRILSSLLQEE